MEQNNIKKIVVIGPESTGKSTLCEQLAQHYKTEWCAEFARAYLLSNGIRYTYEDLALIARGQIALEEQALQALHHQWLQSIKNNFDDNHSHKRTEYTPLLFIDTDMYVMKVWCEYVFGKCHQYILEEIANRKYDLYLLCNIDLPWVKDELRDYPDEKPRQELFNMYKDILHNQSTPWVEIKGNHHQRLQNAIEAIETTIIKKTS